MSNSLAIAATTVVLGDVVKSGLGAIPGAGVTSVRPDEKEGNAPSPEANIFLYQVTPNAALRNAELPTRGANGELRHRPQLGLDLHYVISFYGDEATLEPQRLLGGALAALHARPRLTRAAIEAIIAASSGASPHDPRRFLAKTDLHQQVEHVVFTPASLNLDELSKLWSTLFRVPYVLSVAYEASVVLVEAQLTARPPLPVRARTVRVEAAEVPLVESIEAAAGPEEAIVAGATIVVRGQRLRGEATRLRVGSAVVEPADEDVTETEIRLLLGAPLFAAGALRAGAQALQVLHLLGLGEPPTPHRGFESNAVPFLLRPTLTSATVSDVSGPQARRSAKVTVVADPPVGKDQRVVLLLGRTTGAGDAFSFPASPRALDADPVEIRIAGVPKGTYLVRIQVDGAESTLEAETAPGPDQGRFVNPTLTIP